MVISETQRRVLGAIREQIDQGMDLIERLQRAHLATTPNVTIPLDTAALRMVEGFVVGPIRLGVQTLIDGGVQNERLTHAAANVGGYTGTGAAMRYVAALGCLRAVVAELLVDYEASIEAGVEVAFAHLQRLIVADEDAQKRWVAAYEKDEPACERLGGVHLLQHGLWAFKTDAAGERSDLVLGEHVGAIGRASLDAARGLVLTEWKRVRPRESADAIQERVEQARRQLALYADGSLAAMELKRVRYVVLVSGGRLPATDDVATNAFRVRHVNIAVEPEPPSRAH